MKQHFSLSKWAQHAIAEKLREDPWFELHRVRLIEQNSEELAFLIQQEIDKLDGPICVIGTDAERNDHPAVEVDISFNITEVVPLNRSYAGFVTAIQVAEAIIDDLDGEDWHWNDDLRHEVPNEGAGILVAHTTFRALLDRPNDGEVDCIGS